MVDVASLETSVGTVLLAANEHGLCRLALPTEQEHARFQEWLNRLPVASPKFKVQSSKFKVQSLQLPVPDPWPLFPNPQSAIRNPQLNGPQSHLTLAKQELSEYLAGARRHFTVPLALEGSAFFQQAWNALSAIPYGQTMTYAALATVLERPRAFRAVGSACAKNPLPLIIPCHRAVGSNGSLTGFAGGLVMKAALLKIEGVFLAPSPAPAGEACPERGRRSGGEGQTHGCTVPS